MAPPKPVRCVALVPARSGSERLRDKNIKLLHGHPVIAYTIGAAIRSECFDAVVVSTDSEHYRGIAARYGAEAPFLRPPSAAGATSPDIEWVEHAIGELEKAGRSFDCFSILRPTSPFRQPATIRRAMDQFLEEGQAVDSLRAVEPCRQHPGKMWVVHGRRMTPLLPLGSPEQPWHSSQMKSLPAIHVQNASLEIAWMRVLTEGRSIAGDVVTPFLTEGVEGFDINDPQDWWLAEHLLADGTAKLPQVQGVSSGDA